MAAKKRPVARKKRGLFRELMSGVEAMRDHREGWLTLKTREVQPISVPPIDADVVRETAVQVDLSELWAPELLRPSRKPWSTA